MIWKVVSRDYSYQGVQGLETERHGESLTFAVSAVLDGKMRSQGATAFNHIQLKLSFTSVPDSNQARHLRTPVLLSASQAQITTLPARCSKLSLARSATRPMPWLMLRDLQ
jgi:hypothetical protein